MSIRTAFVVLFCVIAGAIVPAGGQSERNDDPVQDRGTPTAIPDTPPTPIADLPSEFLDQSPPGTAGSQFTTDFSRATVSFGDILSGGPPRDGIPAIDEPRFVSIRSANQWIGDNEAVLVVDLEGPDGREAKIYPLQILTWHEIVNDTVAGRPVTVSYCPLCNTGIAFDTRHHGAVLDFGTTGRLRFSNLIMYDRQTESWWQQASGRAIAGFFAGSRLTMIPVSMLPFAVAAEQYPDATVLSRETGYSRTYGRNPYVGYDTSDRPFLYRGPEIDTTYDPLERVISIEYDGDVTAVAYSVLREARIVPLELGTTDVVVLWQPGTASALDDNEVAGGRDVGTATAFVSETEDGTPVQITDATEDGFRAADGTVWNIAGHAVSGPMTGARLRPIPAVQHFWFSHAALVRSVE